MRRRSTIRTTTAAAALLLAACGSTTDGVDEVTPPAPDDERQQPDAGTEDADTDAEASDDPEEPLASPEDPPQDPAGLPDPDDLIEDGSFRGEGIVLPAIDGWKFDPAALLQGLVLASDDAGLQQLAGQAVDVDTLPEPLTFEQLLAANREQFAQEPSLDEEVEIEGAVAAQQLRYDALPPRQEGQPETSLVLIVADDGDGRLAVFTYAAAPDDYQDGAAEQLVDGAGFDDDSDPTPPPAAPAEPAR